MKIRPEAVGAGNENRSTDGPGEQQAIARRWFCQRSRGGGFP